MGGQIPSGLTLIEDVCLEPNKNLTPKYLRLPYVIFNVINSIGTINTGKGSSVLQVIKN